MYINKGPSTDIMDQIDGFDLFNSQYLVKLDLLKCESKVITKNEKRLDLLTKQYFSDYNNYGLLGIKNRILTKEDLVIGNSLNVPTESEIRTIYRKG